MTHIQAAGCMLDGANMLNRIIQIQPRSFQYLTEDELEQTGMPVFGTQRGIHLGLIAQELEVVFPELVIDAVSELNHDPGESGEGETVSTKGINYNGLVSALIAGMQEQQDQIDELEARIAALEAMMQE